MTDCCLCVCLRPHHYKRLIANLYPSDATGTEEDLTAHAVSKLTEYARTRPSKLGNIGKELSSRIKRDLRKLRFGFVSVAVQALEVLIESCGARSGTSTTPGSLDSFEEFVTEVVLLLLPNDSMFVRALGGKLCRQFVASQDFFDNRSYLDQFLDPILALCKPADVTDEASTQAQVAAFGALDQIVHLAAPSSQSLEWIAQQSIPVVLDVARQHMVPDGSQEPSAVAKAVSSSIQEFGLVVNPATARYVYGPVFQWMDSTVWHPLDLSTHCLKLLDDSPHEFRPMRSNTGAGTGAGVSVGGDRPMTAGALAPRPGLSIPAFVLILRHVSDLEPPARRDGSSRHLTSATAATSSMAGGLVAGSGVGGAVPSGAARRAGSTAGSDAGGGSLSLEQYIRVCTSAMRVATALVSRSQNYVGGWLHEVVDHVLPLLVEPNAHVDPQQELVSSVTDLLMAFARRLPSSHELVRLLDDLLEWFMPQDDAASVSGRSDKGGSSDSQNPSPLSHRLSGRRVSIARTMSLRLMRAADQIDGRLRVLTVVYAVSKLLNHQRSAGGRHGESSWTLPPSITAALEQGLCAVDSNIRVMAMKTLYELLCGSADDIEEADAGGARGGPRTPTRGSPAGAGAGAGTGAGAGGSIDSPSATSGQAPSAADRADDSPIQLDAVSPLLPSTSSPAGVSDGGGGGGGGVARSPPSRVVQWPNPSRDPLSTTQRAVLFSSLLHLVKLLAKRASRPIPPGATAEAVTTEAVWLVRVVRVLVSTGGIGDVWRVVPFAFAIQDVADGKPLPVQDVDHMEVLAGSVGPQASAVPVSMEHLTTPSLPDGGDPAWNPAQKLIHMVTAAVLQVLAHISRSSSLNTYVAQVVTHRRAADLDDNELVVLTNGLTFAKYVSLTSPRRVVGSPSDAPAVDAPAAKAAAAAASSPSSSEPISPWFSRRVVADNLLQSGLVGPVLVALGPFPSTHSSRNARHLLRKSQVPVSPELEATARELLYAPAMLFAEGTLSSAVGVHMLDPVAKHTSEQRMVPPMETHAAPAAESAAPSSSPQSRTDRGIGGGEASRPIPGSGSGTNAAGRPTDLRVPSETPAYPDGSTEAVDVAAVLDILGGPSLPTPAPRVISPSPLDGPTPPLRKGPSWMSMEMHLAHPADERRTEYHVLASYRHHPSLRVAVDNATMSDLFTDPTPRAVL